MQEEPEKRRLLEPLRDRRRLIWLTFDEGDKMWVAWVEHNGLASDLNRTPNAGEVLRLMGDTFRVKVDIGGERRKSCRQPNTDQS